MNPKAELAELVDDHLSRNANMDTMALGSAIVGLAKIWSAYNDAQAKRGNWSTMLGNLKSGVADLAPALPHLRKMGQGVAALVELAEREVVFATELQNDIIRVSAGESTNV